MPKRGPRHSLDTRPGLVLVASYWPGWSYDLTSWRLEISTEGAVVQDVEICRPQDKRQSKLVREIGEKAAVDLLALAKKLGFERMQDHRATVTDAEDCTLWLRIGTLGKRVNVYGMRALRDDPEVARFGEIWSAMLAHAPFPEPATTDADYPLR